MTSVHFRRLRIRDIRHETADAISLAFDIPEELKQEFSFIQGQHLTLRAMVDGEDLRRSYSICSGLDDDEIRVAIKRLPEGKFSGYAHDTLKVGDDIEVMPPLGRFHTELNPENDKHYLAVVAGSGITPVMSLIKTTLTREPQSRFTLVYGNRNVGSIIFRGALDSVKSRFPDRFHLIHVLSRAARDVDLFNGRIDGDKIKALSESLVPLSSVDEVFLCGPQTMIEGVRETLTSELGFPPECVHFELFGTAADRRPPAAVEQADGPMRQVTVIADGKRTTINLPTEGMGILDAALAAGADLPFACKGGVCCTCRAKLVEGEVTMDANYALEPQEVDAGFILTCQSHPTTDHVVVDFDHI